MSSLSVPASRIAGHRAMALIEARRMARHPVFVLGVVLSFVVLGLYVVLVGDETGVPVALTLPLLGAFYIGLTSVIAAARLTRSTEVAVEAVATAPGTEARRTLALAATGIPPFLAGLVFTVALVVAAKVIGVAPQEWWFGTLPDWQVWSIVLACPVACLDGALLGVTVGRWLRFRGASAVVSWLGGNELVQAIVGGIVALAGTAYVHRSRHAGRADLNREENMLDRGQPVVLEGWANEAAGLARVRYRGTSWDARIPAGTPRPVPGTTLYIAAQEGNMLVLVDAPPAR